MLSKKEASGNEQLVEVILDSEGKDGDQLIREVDAVYKKFKEVLLEEKRNRLKIKLQVFEVKIRNYVIGHAQSFEHVEITDQFNKEFMVDFNMGIITPEQADNLYDYILNELLSNRSSIKEKDNLLAQMEDRISQLSENVEFFSEEDIDKLNALFEKFNIFNLEIIGVINMKIIPPKPKGVWSGIQQFIKDLEQFLDNFFRKH